MNQNLQDIAAKQLLEVLAEVNRLLRDHSVALRRESDVTTAQTFPLEAASYTSGPRLEGYVEAILVNGDVISWCLDVAWSQNSWVVEATLDKKTGDRQRTLKELPTAIASDFYSFLQELKRVTRELLALTITEAGSA